MCRLWKPLIESQCQSQNGQVLALTLATLLSKEKGAVSPTLTRAKACVVHAVHAIESASVVPTAGGPLHFGPPRCCSRPKLVKSVQNNAAGRFLFYGVQQAMRHH